MNNKNESQSYESEINIEDDMSIKGNYDSENKIKNYKGQSINILNANQFEKHKESLSKEKKSHRVPLSQNYNKELSNIFANFLKNKRFKISNDFDEKNSKKFLDKKDKCLQKIILSDIIEEKEKDNFNEKGKKSKSRRKSGIHEKNTNYSIVISDYDNSSKLEVKYNYSVQFKPRKLDKSKKNNNLSKYFLNNNESNLKISK